jgi:hypothetical protein
VGSSRQAERNVAIALLGAVLFVEAPQGVGPDEGRVARDDERVAREALEERLGGEEGVAGALLDGLLGEAAVLGGGLDLVGLVADDDDDVLDAGQAEVAEDEVEDGRPRISCSTLGRSDFIRTPFRRRARRP